jgi:nucleoside-diphosphate-sugar epimerase
MKVLVTGASGFLGKHLVQKLVARGDEVSALVWPTSTSSVLQNLPVTIIEGPVQNADLVMRAAQGQDVVFYCAGKVADWGRGASIIRLMLKAPETCLKQAVPQQSNTLSTSALLWSWGFLTQLR